MSSAVQAGFIQKQNRIVALIIKYPIIPTLVFFVVMLIVFAVLSPINRVGQNIFLSPTNIANIVEATAALSIGAFAMTLILLVGCIDLSAESTIALCSVVLGMCLETLRVSFPVALLITFLAGIGCGMVNAALVIKFKVESFLATIAVAMVFSGIAYVVSGSRTVLLTNRDTLVRWFGPMGTGGHFLGLPMLFWWTLLCLVGMYLLISRSKFGRWAQATGGNMQAAYSSGVNVNMVRAVAFIIMGAFCALISIIFCARLSSSSPSFGQHMGLRLIIASVLGGTNFTGDGGNVFGTILGSLVMGVLTNGLGIIGVNIYIQQVVTGIVIVIAVVFSIYISSKK